MPKQNSLGLLSIIALLVLLITGMTWYHNELYHKNPAVVSADEASNQKTYSIPMNGYQKPKIVPEDKSNTSESVDILAMITALDLSKEKQDQSIELIQNLLKEEELMSQSLNKLLITQTAEDANPSEKIAVLQRDFQNKLERFQLDFSDLIGEQPSKKLVGVIQGLIVPLLLKNNEPANSMNGEM